MSNPTKILLMLCYDAYGLLEVGSKLFILNGNTLYITVFLNTYSYRFQIFLMCHNIHEKYTGGNITEKQVFGVLGEKWDLTLEIKSRIEQVRTSFKNMQKVLTNRDLRIPLRIRQLHVFSILFCGMEA